MKTIRIGRDRAVQKKPTYKYIFDGSISISTKVYEIPTLFEESDQHPMF